MTSLVLLEYDQAGIKQPSRSAVAAATQLGEAHGLVVGKDIQGTAEAAAKLPGLSKVLVADAAEYEHPLAEPIAALMVELAPSYSHLFAAATALSLQRGVVPPTINQETPDPDCDLDYVPNMAREIPVRAAISNSFGFGGQNASLVLTRH